MQDGTEGLLQVWVSLRSRQEFLATTEFLVLCCDRGSLCRGMVLRLQAVARLRHSLSMSQQCFASLSRQRFPCRDRDGHDKRSGVALFMLRQSLVKAKGFYVVTRQFPCRDNVRP